MKQLFVVIAGFMLMPCMMAQDAPVYHPIDKQEWQETVDGISYNEKSKPPEKLEFEEPGIPRGLLSTQFLRIVAFVIVAAILVLVILQLFGRGIFGNKKVVPVVTNVINDLDERPMETDLDRYLREALDRGDHRMAVRIYYLMILRALNDRSLIRWKKEKTNYDYLMEVRTHPEFHRLSNMTLIFDHVWYGERNITPQEFSAIRPGFSDLIQQIGKAP